MGQDLCRAVNADAPFCRILLDAAFSWSSNIIGWSRSISQSDYIEPVHQQRPCRGHSKIGYKRDASYSRSSRVLWIRSWWLWGITGRAEPTANWVTSTLRTKFSPTTETFKDYALPGPSPTPYALTIAPDNIIWYASTDQDTVGSLNPSTGQIVEYPFPHSEAFIRELFPDAAGRLWFTSPPNHTVGYFYLAQPPSAPRAANADHAKR